MSLHFEQARLRTAWLLGDVDQVCVRLPILKDRYLQAGDRFDAAGAELELAAKLAWLGDADQRRGRPRRPRPSGAVDPEPDGPHHAPRR